MGPFPVDPRELMESGSYYLKLLGTCEVKSPDGSPVDVSRGKPLALLAHVALTPEPLSRDELASFLWAGSTRERARGSLRQALWQLRQTFGEDLFDTDDPVTLTEGRVVTDVGRLRDHLAAAELEEALELWTGPPMEGIQVSGEPSWERWVDELRRDLERRLGGALSDRGNGEREAGPGADAIRWLDKAREVQPYRLQHHLDLAEALLEVRDFDEAARTLTTARNQFDDPSALEEIRAAEERLTEIRRGTVLAGSAAQPSLRLEFTGRAEEFSALIRQWNQVRDGETGIGLLLGEAGIGKTRLAEEVALMARSAGGRVVQVKGEDSERPIEWALLGELVEALLGLSGAAGISSGSEEVLRTLVPSLPGRGRRRRSTGEGLPFSLPRTRPSAAISDALQDLLAAVAEDAPLLVVVDDLQWADTESRAVLARAATRMEEEPVFFIVTSRTGGREVSPRMRKTLDLLSRGQRAISLELAPLSTEEIRTLLERTLVAPDRTEMERVVDRIIRTSRGNPLFIIELLKVLRDEGMLEEAADSTWALVPGKVPEELPLPASLRELIERQLTNLSQEASLVAAHLARARHPASPRVVASRTGMTQAELTDGVGELIRRRMVQWESGEKLAFAHDELRAAVARRYQLHVGLTTGGGTHWSLFRTAVVASLVLLMVGAAAYAVTGGTLPSAPSLGGGSLLISLGGDSLLEARAPANSPATGWRIQRVHPHDQPGITPGTPSSAGAGNDLLSWTIGGERGLTGTGRAPSSTSSSSGGVDSGSGDPGGFLDSSGNTRRLEVLRGAGDRRAVDSARVLRPDGSLVDARSWDRVHAASWCGGTPPSLLLSVEDDGEPGLYLWHPEDESMEVLDPPGMPGSLLACAPNGRFAAVVTALDGDLGVHLLNFVTRDSYALPVEDVYEITGLRWDPDEPTPVAVGVEIATADDLQLDWGERRTLEARVQHSDESHSHAGIEWSSQNPGVASVTEDGVVTANRPGRTWLAASFDGWLADSIPVRVRETERSPRVLLWDPVPPLADDLWVADSPFHPSGQGPASWWSQTAVPSSSAWRSLDGFSLPAGGTFELEFTLEGRGEPLQGCLIFIDGPSLPDPGAEGGTALENRSRTAPKICLLLQTDEGDPLQAAMAFHRSFPTVDVEVPESITEGSRRWHHMALALLPDGIGVLHLNGIEVARTPIRLPLDGDGRWHVLLQGMQPRVEGARSSRDFRNVLLWPDVRF